MKNKYFPDEEITQNDLYFMCYMIERIARKIHQKNNYVAQKIGKENLVHLISVANVLHCENPLQVEDDWIKDYGLENGNFDITNVNKKYCEKIPSETAIGKVYARLISATLTKDEDFTDGILRVYSSPVCEKIDDYNCSAYYEPSYVIERAYFNHGEFQIKNKNRGKEK